MFLKAIEGVHPTESDEWHRLVSRAGGLHKDASAYCPDNRSRKQLTILSFPVYDSGDCADYIHNLLSDITSVNGNYIVKYGVQHGPITFDDVRTPERLTCCPFAYPRYEPGPSASRLRPQLLGMEQDQGDQVDQLGPKHRGDRPREPRIYREALSSVASAETDCRIVPQNDVRTAKDLRR